MSVIKTWGAYFQHRERQRGRRLYQAGRVERLSEDVNALVQAQVQGKEKVYTVTIDQNGPTAQFQCTCDLFARGIYCRHIWATLLNIHHHGLQAHPASEDEMDLIEQATPKLPKARKRQAGEQPTRSSEPRWLGRLSLLRPRVLDPEAPPAPALPVARQIFYVVRPDLSMRFRALVVELCQRRPTASGWTQLQPLRLNAPALSELTNPEDRELCALILGGQWVEAQAEENPFPEERRRALYRLPLQAQRSLLQRMIRTGRCYLQNEGELAAEPLKWTGPQPWQLWMTGTRTEEGLTVTLELRRDGENIPIDSPSLLLGGPEGLVIHDDMTAPFDDRDAYHWVSQFRTSSPFGTTPAPIDVPSEDIPRFLDQLYHLPQLPEIDLPEGLARPQQTLHPEPHIELYSPGNDPAFLEAPSPGRNQLSARAWWTYAGSEVKPGEPGQFVSTPDASSLIRRARQQEQALMLTLLNLGFRPHADQNVDRLLLPVRRMAEVVQHLIRQGWHITADQRLIRTAANPRLSVHSGTDWFELRGGFQYQTQQGEQLVQLPQILAALKAGRTTITLSDGSEGLLPEDWLAAHGLLASVGKVREDHLRFGRNQIAVLDTLLGEDVQAEFDEKFTQTRQRLHQFERVEPRDAAPTFIGDLRGYQRQGLGWMQFLRWFGMGGILADDMGLGKTIQVLAMLDDRYGSGKPKKGSDEGMSDPRPVHRPTLVVAPRSVIFNWLDEAERFTPTLHVQAYSGTERHTLREQFDLYDVIVTSYGLVRRDIDLLSDHHFDYVILDEAQTVKNPSSQIARAVRQLKASHRLALTGTPVENHLGDLWSILEFLNPGMLGAHAQFADLLLSGVQDPRSPEAARQAGEALRPFILRRTKKQVLDELPDKTEQTLICQMEPEQRRVYDELLGYYRNNLLGSSGTLTNGRGNMVVLEALLRLRQAACHPALIDPKQNDLPSAKLDLLVEHLQELAEEGNKALVFSQFTSFLQLVRQRLDQKGIDYAYLDGQTRDRRKPVEQFQKDPSCQAFLISLKAGGLGLNLTAANYVFLLDPWWNPAVESQAIDRAYRIGQTEHVFVYRLICEDTVEQRIRELQKHKSQLAEAVVDQSEMLGRLTREDLERLLS